MLEGLGFVKKSARFRISYYNYETGKRELPFELAVTLAKFYDVSLDYIFGLNKNPEKSAKKGNCAYEK